MLRRLTTTATLTVTALLATAATALADYPPGTTVQGTTVKGTTVETVAPEQSVAFTGSNTLLWLAALAVLLAIGVALIAWSRRPSKAAS